MGSRTFPSFRIWLGEYHLGEFVYVDLVADVECDEDSFTRGSPYCVFDPTIPASGYI